MSTERREFVVVGAGPAGAVAARELALAGRDVLLVDRAHFPRDKVCGSCLGGAALHHLRALDLLPQDGRALPHLDLLAGRRRARLPLPDRRVVSRRTLDAHLVDAARAAGAEVLTGTRASRVGLRDDGLELRLDAEGDAPGHAEQDAPGRVVRAGLVLAADGLAGGLLPAGRPRAASRIGLGHVFPAEVTAAHDPGEGVTMVCGRAGYVGLVRDEHGRLDVAAAVDPAALRGREPGELVNALLADAGRPPLPPARWAATAALTRSPPGRAPRVLPVGDAAGYVEPFTGEGIGWALASGRAVVPFALAGWRDDLDLRWRARHRTLLDRRLCRATAAALRHPWLVGVAVALLRLAPGLARPFLRAPTTGAVR